MAKRTNTMAQTAPARIGLIPPEIIREAKKLAARAFPSFFHSESGALESASFVEGKGRSGRAVTYLAITTSKASELARIGDSAAKLDDEISRWIGIRESAEACYGAAESDRIIAADAIERADTMLAVLYLRATGSAP